MFKTLCNVVAPALAAIFVVTISAGRLQAQSPGPDQLTVTVVDSTGGHVTDSSIVLRRGNIEKATKTGKDGSATMQGLAPGEWTLVVTKQGFAGKERPVVIADSHVAVSVALEVAPVDQKITVVGQPEIPSNVRLNSSASGGTYLDVAVRDLPANLNVISQDLMRERGVTSLLDALELAPGITTWVDSGAIPGIDARGFSSTDAGISMTRDGVRQNTVPQAGRNLDTFGIDRVEVLKGPGALLYGEGAAASTINVVTKPPQHTYGVDSLFSYGSFGNTRVGVGLHLPLHRSLTLNFNASYQRGGGYVDRTGNQMRSINGSLLWTPKDYLTINASAVYNDDNVHSYYGTPLLNTEVDPNIDYVRLGATSFLDPRTRYTNYNMQDNLNKAHNPSAHVSEDILLPGGWRLRNDTYLYEQRVDWRNFESTSYTVATGKVALGSYFLAKRNDFQVGDSLSVRKSLALWGHAINFVSGVKFDQNRQHRWATPSPSGVSAIALDLIDPAPVYDPGLNYVKNRDVYTNTWNGYTEGLVRLTTKLTARAAVRVDHISNRRFDAATSVNSSKTYTPVTGTYGVVYAIIPNINLYVGNSTGVQPTTPLVSLTSSSFGFSLQPSRGWEGGVKATAFKGRLDTTVSYFSMGKSNILTQTIVDNVRLQQQIGKLYSRGVELSFASEPIRNFTLQGDLTSQNAEYEEFNENLGTGVVSRAGNDVPQTPAVVWNVTPGYRWGLLSGSVTVRTLGARWRDTANTLRLSPYTTLNANISFRFPRGARLTLTGRNLTDEVYIARNNSNTTGRIAAPRNYSLQLTKSF